MAGRRRCFAKNISICDHFCKAERFWTCHWAFLDHSLQVILPLINKSRGSFWSVSTLIGVFLQLHQPGLKQQLLLWGKGISLFRRTLEKSCTHWNFNWINWVSKRQMFLWGKGVSPIQESQRKVIYPTRTSTFSKFFGRFSCDQKTKTKIIKWNLLGNMFCQNFMFSMLTKCLYKKCFVNVQL